MAPPIRPAFDNATSRIAGVLHGSQLLHFRSDFSLHDPLAFFHETVHWFQRKTLFNWCLNRLLITAYLEENQIHKRMLYDKYIVARRMLLPYSEGLALFAEFDYFPANYAIGAGDHNDFDELFELIISDRFSFQSYERLEAWELNGKADAFLRAYRLSRDGLLKRERLMMMPLGSGHPHISGYLFIKRAVAAAKRRGLFSYIHDGAIMTGLTWYVYEAPELCRLVNDDDCVGTAFEEAFKSALARRLDQLWLGPKAGEILERFDRRGGSERAKPELNDPEARAAAESAHSNQCDQLLYALFRESVLDHVRPDETMAEYDERIGPNAPPAINGFNVLMAMDAARFGVFDGVLAKSGDDWVLRIGEDGIDIAVDALGPPSPRPERYRWTTDRVVGSRARLVEALFFLDRRLFHISFVDTPKGMIHLTHKTDDRRVGDGPIGRYLEKAYRIDGILTNMQTELKSFEAGTTRSYRQSVVDTEELYGGPAREICERHLPPGPGVKRVSDLFADRKERQNFAAFSLILPTHTYADEHFASLQAKVERYLPSFGLEALNLRKVRAYFRKGEPYFYTDRLGRRPIAFKSGTLI